MKDDQVFELIMSKMDTIHGDVKSVAKSLQEHIDDDRLLKSDVNLIKRGFQAGVGAIGLWLAWLGVRS